MRSRHACAGRLRRSGCAATPRRPGGLIFGALAEEGEQLLGGLLGALLGEEVVAVERAAGNRAGRVLAPGGEHVEMTLHHRAAAPQRQDRTGDLVREIGLFVGMIFANPELMIVSGEPRVLYFFGTVVISASRSALLFGLPLLGAVAVSAFVLVSEAVARERRRHIGGKRRPGLVLYRSHIPLRLFAVTYAVEVPVILTNPAVATTVRNMVLILLGIRVVWFLLFVFRTEQEIGRVLGAPWKLADRLPVYRPAAGVHALLCALALFLYVARVIVA